MNSRAMMAGPAEELQEGRTAVVALLAAKAISNVGNMITALAIPWFVLVTTGSAARTGIVAFTQVFPIVLASFFGGPLVDRFSNKRLSIIADITSGVTVAAIPLLHHTIGLDFWMLLALVFLGAILDTPGGTARGAMLPTLIERSGFQIERVNAADHMLLNFCNLVGPALAGVLVAWIGASDVLLADAASFAISAAVFAALVPDLRQRSERQSAYLDDVKEGLRVVRDDLLLKSLLIQAALINFVGAPLFAVVFPVYSKERYDSPRALGLMLAAFGAGAILGALAYGAVGARFSRWFLLFSMMLLAGIVLALLVFMPPLWLAAVLIATSGFGTGSVNPLVTTILQERTAPEMRGRVFGTVSAIAQIAAPLGMLIAGAALSGFGTRAVIGAIGVLFLLITLLFLRQRAVWLADRPRPQTPASAASSE